MNTFVLLTPFKKDNFIQVRTNFEGQFGASVLDYFINVFVPAVDSKLATVLPCATKVKKSILATAANFDADLDLAVHLYGSVSVFLCSDSSDMDIAAVQKGNTSEEVTRA